jgi:hypothetical protein
MVREKHHVAIDALSSKYESKGSVGRSRGKIVKISNAIAKFMIFGEEQQNVIIVDEIFV